MLNISDQIPWIYNTDHSRIWLSPMWLPEVVIIVVAHQEQQSQIPYFWPEKESKFMTWRVSSQQIRCWQPLSYLINRVKPFGGKRDHLHYSSGNRVRRTCEDMVGGIWGDRRMCGQIVKALLHKLDSRQMWAAASWKEYALLNFCISLPA